MRCGALFTSRRVRASAAISVSVVVEPPRPAPAELHPRAECRRAPDVKDHPELRAQWRALPKSIRPHDWVTETGVKQVPGSLLIAEEQRPPEGYYHG